MVAMKDLVGVASNATLTKGVHVKLTLYCKMQPYMIVGSRPRKAWIGRLIRQGVLFEQTRRVHLGENLYSAAAIPVSRSYFTFA